MKKNLLTTVFSILISFSFGQNWQWAKSIQLPYSEYNYRNVQISTESSGNFYASANQWEGNYGDPNGSCLLKFDPNGNEIWRKTFTDKFRILKIKTGSSGNLLVAGDFKDTLLINGITYISQNKNDGFFCSLDANGNLLWFQQISGDGNENAADISTDNFGNYFITGLFSNQSHVDGNILNTTGVGSTFIFKINNNGNILSVINTNTIDSAGINNGLRIGSDLAGNTYIFGGYEQVKMNATSLVNQSMYGSQFMAKFDATGQLIFLKHLIADTEKFNSFSVGNDGIYFTGCGGWTSGGWTLTKKYSLDGTLIWTKSNSGYYYQYHSEDIEPNSTGYYTLGDEGNSNVPSWQYSYSLMLSNFDPDGTQTIIRVPSTEGVEGYDIERSGINAYVIIGQAPDSISFGSTTISKTNGFLFIVKLSDAVDAGISDHNSVTENVTLFPNPSTGLFTVQLSHPAEKGKLCVYDLLGNCILSRQLDNAISQEVDLSGKSNGIYLIEIDTGKEKINKKMILN